ncbi:MAG: AMP-binding protein [Verrucomicrobia bacterium]|jgi:O-succinylbenzoic acid--CoA ligase|nr:AMP-binding protein [Verrucomicrobiota bacterium]
MEFDLKQIRRDWIEGVSGRVFMEKFEAAHLRLLAVPEELRCRGALLCERDPVKFAVAFFATVSLRFPVVLANPNWGEQEWEAFAGLVAPVLGFGAEANGGSMPGIASEAPAKAVPSVGQPDAVFTPLRSGATPGAASEAPTNGGALEAGAILIPTGGSTGGVKLAIHDWETLAAACAGVQRFLGGGPVNSCCVLPLYHVSGLMQLLRAYHSGGSIRFDEADVAGRCLSYVPTQLQRAIGKPKLLRELVKARAIFVGGAALAEGVAEKVRELKLPVVPVYGMTETAAMVAAVPKEDFDKDYGAGAVALGGARFGIEADGRIRIGSPALFKGYHGREPMDLSAGYVADDVGYLDEAGRLHVIGRADRLINSGGEKIDPLEVERAFCRLDGVDEALAVGVPDAEWGERLVVFYTGRQLGDWKTELEGVLARFKIPKEVVWVAALPLDEKGKFTGVVGASLVKTAGLGLGQGGAVVTSDAPTTGVPCAGEAGAVVTSDAPTTGVPCAGQAGAVVTSDAPTDQRDAVVTSDAPTDQRSSSRLLERKTQNLRKGRISIPGARYFITICTKDRKTALTRAEVAESVLDVWRLQHLDGDYTFHCGTSMPDHVHFLVTLGARLSVGQCIVKFKAKTKNSLLVSGLSWQRDFYDHRLRANDAMEGFAKYTFLNPYRKSLLPCQEVWPHWNISREYRPEFLQYLDGSGAPPEVWVRKPMDIRRLIEEDLRSEENPPD